MSTYEKLASVLLVLLAALLLVVWSAQPRGRLSDFDESAGQDFKMGPFDTVAGMQTMGGLEQDCGPQQPVIIAALHDLTERLAEQAPALGVPGDWEDFEVNAQTLGVLCNKTASITLRDGRGDTLVVDKAPFSRAVPQGAGAGDVGTVVSLAATVTTLGSTTPSSPQAAASILIPDRYLDAGGR